MRHQSGSAGLLPYRRQGQVVGLRGGLLPGAGRRRSGRCGEDLLRHPDREDAIPGVGLRRSRHPVAQHHLDLSRDADLGFTFIGINYYDGQGFLGRRELGVESAIELDGASVCIQTGTTTELNLADFFRVNGIGYEPVPLETNAEARAAYEAERCDVYTTDVSGLAATKSTFDDPDAHMVYPEIISKEPLGPLVRQGDDQWADIARWVLNALITAEELGVTQANVAEMAKGTDHPEINRMLGTEGSLGEMLGLDAEWAVRAIAAEGNYAEIFEKYLGAGSPLGLPRGFSALYSDGGILYSPPFR